MFQFTFFIDIKKNTIFDMFNKIISKIFKDTFNLIILVKRAINEIND